MSRLKIRRKALRDPRDKEIERLKQEIDKLRIELLDQHPYSLDVSLKCTSGNASFNGEVSVSDVNGVKLAQTPIEGFFRSTRRKESVRSFAIPMVFCYGTHSEVFLDDPVSPDWQKHAEKELSKKSPEHLVQMRARARR